MKGIPINNNKVLGIDLLYFPFSHTFIYVYMFSSLVLKVY